MDSIYDVEGSVCGVQPPNKCRSKGSFLRDVPKYYMLWPQSTTLRPGREPVRLWP